MTPLMVDAQNEELVALPLVVDAEGGHRPAAHGGSVCERLDRTIELPVIEPPKETEGAVDQARSCVWIALCEEIHCSGEVCDRFRGQDHAHLRARASSSCWATSASTPLPAASERRAWCRPSCSSSVS